MKLDFNIALGRSYRSNSQISRVLTENWVGENLYCPSCGNQVLTKYPDNKPVADFYCLKCSQDFELKSKAGEIGTKIVDGAYHSMISRITSENNPNFFFLTYDKNSWTVRNLVIIPKHFFVPAMIEKRPPLSITAKRAGWIGCNINLQSIPELGKIFIVKDRNVTKKKDVIDKWSKSLFLQNKNSDVRGWTLDVLRCVDMIPSKTFSLEDMYSFEGRLKLLYPGNNFIKDKIRQQLQYLRDKGILEFVSRGSYLKL